LVCTVQFTWDSEAKVWFATSDDVPGFALEHDSLDRLCERVLIALSDFLSDDIAKDTEVTFNYRIIRTDRLVCSG